MCVLYLVQTLLLLTKLRGNHEANGPTLGQARMTLHVPRNNLERVFVTQSSGAIEDNRCGRADGRGTCVWRDVFTAKFGGREGRRAYSQVGITRESALWVFRRLGADCRPETAHDLK